MFTGIIRHVSPINKADVLDASRTFQIARPRGWRLKAGDSVAVNGICSTVQRTHGATFTASYMSETLRCTTASAWHKNERVNLEQSLRLADRLDGHLVQGHVDATGRIVTIASAKGAYVVKVSVPKPYRRFIAAKGSVALDGVSLTIVDAAKTWFSVALIDYTLRHTNLGEKKPGDEVNVEVDIIAKYVYGHEK